MYILGDNIDRGPKPVELLKYIYEQDNIISLMGNHEEYLLEYFNKGLDDSDTSLWDMNDGQITRLAINKLYKDDPIFCRNIIDDIKNWNSCMILDLYIISHAGYNALKLKDTTLNIESLNQMTHEDFTWSREDFFKHEGIDDYITIFGHTPTRNIRLSLDQQESDNIWVCPKFGDKIGIDGAIAYGGQLNCINLDTMEITVVS